MFTDAVVPAAMLSVELIVVLATAVRIARAVAPARDEILDRAVIALVTGVAHVIGVLLLLGAVGLLRRGPVLAAIIVVGACAFRLVPRVQTERPAPRALRPSTVLVSLTGLWFFVLWLVSSIGSPSAESDTNQYHLPNAAFWLRRASLWPLPPATPGYFTATYPSNGELAGLFLMLPTHDDRLAYVAPLVFAVLVVLGTGLLARELGGTASTGALMGIAIASSPLVYSTQVRSLMVDMPAAAGLVAGLALGLGARRRRDPVRLALAGVAFGLAIGAKYPVLVPGVIGMLAVAALAPRRARLRAGAWVALGAAPMAAFWYVRTWVATGNPVFPKGVTVGGHALLTGGRSPLNLYATSVLQHVRTGNTEVLARWARLGRSELGPALLVLAAGLVVVGWKLCTRRSRLWLFVAGVVAVSAVSYLATPFTGGGPSGVAFLVASQLRYALPFAFLAAAAAGVLPPLAAWPPAVAAIAFNVVQLLRGPAFRADITPSVAALGLASLSAVVVVALVPVVAGADVGAWASRLRARRPRARAPVAALATVAVMVTCAVPATALLHRMRPRTTRDLVAAALRRSDSPSRVVLLVGVIDVRPSLGPALSRDVVSVRGVGAAHEEPVGTTAALDQQVAALQPAVIVVGPSPIATPDGWTPPGWRKVGSGAGGEVYVPPTSSNVEAPPLPPVSNAAS
ncbi:MAG: glycosyltransferase family 39 protein [Actinobacteria bacterium]|nr:glycosyltransferase family 39 protein [Actinomycetota bacterium]